MKKVVKIGSCPKCKKELSRRRSIHINKPKPTKCNHCGFVIENPYEVFKPNVN